MNNENFSIIIKVNITNIQINLKVNKISFYTDNVLSLTIDKNILYRVKNRIIIDYPWLEIEDDKLK